MTTTPRIAILNARDTLLGFLDNGAPGGLHYFDECLHLYLAGSAYTFTCRVLTCEDSQMLDVGNKLSFRWNNKDYYLNIVKAEKDELYTEVECFGLTFEFLNEECDAYESPDAKTLAAYIAQWGAETMDLRIIHNEVADRALKLKWEGRDTLLKRLFSLATNFEVELEFQTILNKDYSLAYNNLYIVKSMGTDRTAEVLRYGKEIEGLGKSSDISELYTAIRPRGKDGLTLSGYSHAKESDGCYLRGEDILNPSAKDRFPAVSPTSAEGYIARYWDCEVEDQATLYGRALAELRKNSVPKISYAVEGYVDAGVGDRFTIEDSQYKPTLYVEARIVEQEICFTDPSQSKTTFDNFTEVNSQLSSSILAQVQQLVEKYKTYQCGISSTAGTTFINGVGQSTLTAYVRDNGSDVTDKFTIRWYKAGTEIATGKSITVQTTDFEDTAVYGFKAFDGTGALRGEYELTFANVADGVSDYLHIKYSDDGGQTFTANDGRDPGKWMGQYHSASPVDSMDPADYTWAKIGGEDGKDGETQKLVSMATEYYLSTSDTIQAGGSWTTTKPDYVEGKYLWTRIKAVYENPAATAYTQPTLDSDWLNAGRAIQAAQTAVTEANAASSAASDALTQAAAAKAAADAVSAELAPIKTGVQEAKDAAADAKKEIADKTTQMLLDIGDTYATKSDVTDIEGGLQAQITANATEIATKVSETTYQQNKADVDGQLASLNSDLSTAQSTLTDLQSNQSAAAEKLAKAEADLKAAQDAVESLETSQTATASQVAAAQKALQDAQTAVSKAQADVDAANTEIGKVKTDIGDIQADITDLTSRVTTAETSIKQNSDAIALRATKTEVNTAIADAKSEMAAEFEVKANEITQSVSAVDTKVNGLQQQKVEYFYYLSTSPDTCTGGSWSTTKPAETAGKYIWQKIKTTYVSGASTESSPARLTGKDGADGTPALHISITPEWSGSTCTLTAHVFKGGTELSDTQVVALGALKWYEGTTFIANGKQLTRTVTTKKVLECRLESGGGGLMPEFITLADGSLAVKGRNLLRDTQTTELESTDAGYLQTGLLPLAIDCKALQGQNVAVSIQCDCENAVAKTTGSYQRMGYELNIGFEDGTAQYIGVWVEFSSTPRTVHSKFSKTYTILDKPIKSATSSRIYLQNFTADSAKVSKPKLEFGDTVTPYSPAPEDEEAV